MKKSIYFFIVIICFLFIVNLQSKVYAADECLVNVYGVVVDENNQPMKDIKVYYNDEEKAVTNENGEYSIWINEENGKTGTISYSKPGYKKTQQGIRTIGYKINNDDKYKDIKTVQTLYYGNDSCKDVYDNIINKKLKQSFSFLGLNYEGVYVNSNTVNINKAISDNLEFNHKDTKCYVFNYITDDNIDSLISFLNLGAHKLINLYDMFVNTDINGNNLKNRIESNIKTKNILKKTFDPMTINGIMATKNLNFMYQYDNSLILSEEKASNVSSDEKIEIEINKENDYEIKVVMKSDTATGGETSSGNVKITGNITNSNGTDLKNLDVEMNVYNQDGTFCTQVAKNIKQKNFEYLANLEKDKTYYIEYIFSEEAFEKGYSIQEYDIEDKTSSDSTSDSKIIRYAKNNNPYTVPDEINLNTETDLDKYENTKLIARTENFTVKTYEEAQYAEDGTFKGNETKYSQIEANIILKDRENLNIELSTNVTNIKVVLTNGNVFLNQKVGPDFWSIDNQKYIFMDNDIIYGATVFIEYEVKIKNKGNTTENKFNLLNYINNYEGMFVTYNPDEKLLSNSNITNKSQGWEIDTSPPNVNYSSDIITDIKLKNEMVIPNGEEEISKRFIVSQKITPQTDSMFQNDVAITEYKNKEKQRNGTYNNYKRAGTKQLFSSSETIYVLIPFGGSPKDNIIANIKWLFYKFNL